MVALLLIGLTDTPETGLNHLHRGRGGPIRRTKCPPAVVGKRGHMILSLLVLYGQGPGCCSVSWVARVVRGNASYRNTSRHVCMCIDNTARHPLEYPDLDAARIQRSQRDVFWKLESTRVTINLSLKQVSLNTVAIRFDVFPATISVKANIPTFKNRPAFFPLAACAHTRSRSSWSLRR